MSIRALLRSWFSGKEVQDAEQAPDAIICVKTFAHRYEAEIAKSLLEAHDIPSLVIAEDVGGTRPMLTQVDGGIRLLLRRDQAELAMQLLDSVPRDA